MLLRRITIHLSTQNWAAICIDLLVVIIGVFLAFQVERWYDGTRLHATEAAHLTALAADFALIREDLEWNIERQKRSTAAALVLLEERVRDPIELPHDKFYALLNDTLLGVAFSDVSRTYDALVATGDLEALRDESLKLALADFYGEAKQGIDWSNKRSLRAETVDPYVLRNLDYIALMRKAHPETEDTQRMMSTRPTDQFQETIKNDDFEAIIGALWHTSHEAMRGGEYLLERVEEVEALLRDSMRDTELPN